MQFIKKQYTKHYKNTNEIAKTNKILTEDKIMKLVYQILSTKLRILLVPSKTQTTKN